MLILNPAKNIIDLCGGPQVVSEMTGRTFWRVQRWTWPRAKDGCDGIIPQEAERLILSRAQEFGIDGLVRDLFFEGDGLLSERDLLILTMIMDGLSHRDIADELGVELKEVSETEGRLRSSGRVNPVVWKRAARRSAPNYRKRRKGP